MSRDLVLEIGVEEMPAAYMPAALDNLQEIAATRLKEARLDYQEIKAYGTPRRLALLVYNLSSRQQDAVIENRGPRKDKAFNQDGTLTKAGEGFARAQKIAPEELVIKEVSGVEYVFAVKKEAGRPAADVLSLIIPDMIRSLPFPKFMRWGYSELRFPRPIRWLLCVYEGSVVDFELNQVAAGNLTYGHRFLAPGAIPVSGPQEYLDSLKEAYVIVNQEERREMIWKQVKAVAESKGGRPLEDEDLLTEVTFLVEYPTAFYGEFSPSYLEVPPEVLTTTMVENQRYFPVFDERGSLMPGFIGVRNGLADENLAVVRAGNERVLKARLEDAYFFYREDLKEPLHSRVPRLAAVTYHERLGSVGDKVNRLTELAAFISKELKLGDEEHVRRAAYLCKADLVTSMVFEFTELQGVMGRYYALKSGEAPEVAEAIFEHYLPRFAGDKLPETETGIALSLAEKFDNLVACFSIGIKPTGSQDPYALRRQALGVINILWKHNLRLSLSRVISAAYQLLKGMGPDLTEDETIAEVVDFVSQRVRGMLLEEGITYDVVDAVLAVPGDDLVGIRQRAKAVAQYKERREFEDLMVVFGRSANLSSKATRREVVEASFTTQQEKELWEAVRDLKPRFGALMAEDNYEEAMNSLAGLRPAIDQFFDAVMVMVEDEEIRVNRLALLKNVSDMCYAIADFKQITG